MSYKILRHIDMTLDKSSITNAINQIKQFRRELEAKCLELVKELAKEGVNIAKMQVVSMDAVDTGELERSIDAVFFPQERCGVVVADTAYAVYVEYGTGVVGAANPHPEASGAIAIVSKAGKNGDKANAHAGYGRSFTTGENGNTTSTNSSMGWVYRGKDGKFHWTMGMPSRPFMYNTLRWLEEMAPEKAGEMFSQM